MIAHFIKQDIRTHRFSWALCLGLSLVGIALMLAHRRSEVLFLLGYGYFLFALLPSQQIAGVTWRSQHIMSRNYLLSLPIRRKRLFGIMQVRALVFWIPLLALASIGPWFLDDARTGPLTRGFTYPTYLIAVGGAAFWFLNQQLDTQLIWERVTSYVSPRKRFFTWVASLGSLVIQAVIGVSLLGYASIGSAWWLDAYLVGLSIFSFYRTRRRWIGV